MKVLKNYQKNIFDSVPFKNTELPNPAIYSYTENRLHRKFLKDFSKLLRERLRRNYFLVK